MCFMLHFLTLPQVTWSQDVPAVATHVLVDMLMSTLPELGHLSGPQFSHLWNSDDYKTHFILRQINGHVNHSLQALHASRLII